MLSRCLLGKRVLAEIESQLADLRGHLTELYTSSALSQLGFWSTVRLIDVGRDLHPGADEIQTHPVVFTETYETQCYHSRFIVLAQD